MRAMVIEKPGQAFQLRDLPVPEPGPGEAVAKVYCCGAGLTLQHVKAGRSPGKFPLIMGHEITGEISAVGAGVTDLKEGDPVTIYFYLTCGTCRYCEAGQENMCDNFGGFVGRQIDGAYADYVKLPARNFLKLPVGLNYKQIPGEVGVVTDAIATPYKVIRRARIQPGENVAIFGAGGGLGSNMVLVAKWAGARVIAVDRGKKKLDLAKQLGADAVVDVLHDDGLNADVPDQLRAVTDGRGPDVSIDFVSSAWTTETAIAASAKQGRMVVLGGGGDVFQAKTADFLNRELELIGSRYCSRAEVMESLQLVADGEITPYVGEHYALEDAEIAHERLEQGIVMGRAVLDINSFE
jgi:propanol-preferring alcohol dehydrogenase